MTCRAGRPCNPAGRPELRVVLAAPAARVQGRPHEGCAKGLRRVRDLAGADRPPGLSDRSLPGFTGDTRSRLPHRPRSGIGPSANRRRFHTLRCGQGAPWSSCNGPRLAGHSARRTDSMTTGLAGTSWWPPARPVATAAIFSTTSIPSITLPNTAYPKPAGVLSRWSRGALST